jgi:hypothetical protein
MLLNCIRKVVLATAVMLGTMAGPAQAACGTAAPYLINYAFDMSYEVTAIAKYNEYLPDCGSGLANSDTAPVGASLLTDIFPKHDPIGRSLLMGIATDLPLDADGQQHLVLFTNDDWASDARGLAFGTLFPTANEASLIAALASLQAGTGTDDDYGLLTDFASSVSQYGPNGDAAFLFGGSFTAIAFSDGQIIGTGTSFATAAPDGVPEPASWAMAVLGFGAVGAAMRRRTAALKPAL